METCFFLFNNGKTGDPVSGLDSLSGTVIPSGALSEVVRLWRLGVDVLRIHMCR